MKNKILILSLIIFLLLTGCNKNNVSDIGNNNQEVVEEVLVDQYFDESRIDKSKAYTFGEATKNFSFLMNDYITVENGDYDYSEPTKIVFSYTGSEKIEFLSSFYNGYSFNYILDEANYQYFTLTLSDYTKANYHALIEEHNNSLDYDWDGDYEIISETDNLVILKKVMSDSETIYYYGIKFMANGKGLMVEMSDYSEIKRDQSIYVTIINDIFTTIVDDNKDAVLEDKIVSIKNFQGKQIKSYTYINSIDRSRESYILTNNITLTVHLNSQHIYTSDKWNILSNNPYIAFNEDKVYKVLKDGLPEYYQFVDYTGEETKNLGGTIDDLYSLLNKFYK